MLLAALFGCVPAHPKRVEDCEGLLVSARARAECLTTVIPKLFCDDPERAARLVDEKVADAVDRDFIWYQAVTRVEPDETKWCKRIGDDALERRCLEITRRPHLHPELTADYCPNRPPRKGGRPGGPGGPIVPGAGRAPGAPPPDGALPGSAPPSQDAPPASPKPDAP